MGTRATLKTSLNVFRWSEREFTLKELIADYKNMLPFAILVTGGYSEPNERVSTSANEVYWLHDIIKETWVFLRDSRGKKYKVSAEYDAMVIPVRADGTEGKPIPFNEVLLRDDCKFIRFSDPERHVLNEQQQRHSMSFSDLRVVDKQQTYALVVHSIFTDEVMDDGVCVPQIRHLPQGILHPEFNLLPSDLPIRVSLGVSMNSANPDTMFFSVMSDIKRIADSYPHDYLAYMRKNADLEYYDPEVRQVMGHRGNRKRSDPVPVKLRKEPVALTKDIVPQRRLKELRQFYDRGASRLRRPGSGRRGQGHPSTDRRTVAAAMFGDPDMEEVEQEEVDRRRRPVTMIQNAVAEQRAGSRRTVLRPSCGERDAQKRASVAAAMAAGGRSGSSGGEGRLSAVPERSDSCRTLADLPEDINDFSADDVNDSLRLLRLADDDACALRKRLINGRQLAKLPEERLRKEFGLSSSGASKLAEFVRSRITRRTGFDLDTVRRKLPENSYVTLYN